MYFINSISQFFLSASQRTRTRVLRLRYFWNESTLAAFKLSRKLATSHPSTMVFTRSVSFHRLLDPHWQPQCGGTNALLMSFRKNLHSTLRYIIPSRLVAGRINPQIIQRPFTIVLQVDKSGYFELSARDKKCKNILMDVWVSRTEQQYRCC